MDFSRRLASGQTAQVQLLLDGRRSNSGQIAAGYASQVFQDYGVERGAKPPATLNVRNLYNPNLEFKWHVLPSLVAIITTIGCLIVTALSVAREREEGTFDQLLVSPLTPAYIMAGKAVPGVFIAVVQGSFIAVAAAWGYGVPFTGSVLLLLSGMVFYGLALAGVGLFISSISENQQQAFLGVFAFMAPAVMLSGYVAPIENMPRFFQWVAVCDPLSYFIPILKGCFLKGFGFRDAWHLLWPLLAIAFVTLSAALRLFRRHIA
jgi:ABC-2 type transport system permease protein